MRAPLAAVALLLSSAAFAADPSAAPEPKMKASFIGEGGGYKHPDPATDQYMEGSLGAPGGTGAPLPKSEHAAPPPAPSSRVGLPKAGAIKTADPVASASPSPRLASPRAGAPSRSIAGRPPAAERNAPAPGDARLAGRSSLWNGLVQPLDMKGADAGSAGDDQARADADSDYETRILGMRKAPARPSLDAAPPAPVATAPASDLAALASATGGAGRVFVSLELDPQEAGSLRDAVAGLGAATGFAADARFEMMAAGGGRTRISGWMPASHLGDALLRPGVKSLRVETRARPSTPRATAGEFLVGLRVDDPARARESVDAGVRVLKEQTGFKLDRVIGMETAPDGRAVAVVSGTLPLSRLSKAMSLFEVAKILPAGGEPPAPAPSGAAAPAGLAGFMRFAVQHGAWLIIVTLLLALPSLRSPARKLASVFNPYR